MKKENHIREAIDESLQNIHFNAQDTRKVLRAVRSQSTEPAPRKASPQRNSGRLGYALAAAMLVMIIAPVSLIALRLHHDEHPAIKTIAAAPTEATSVPLDIVLPADQIIDSSLIPSDDSLQADDGIFTESDAIAAARACFEARCDTSIFTFEEYTVSVQAAFEYGSDPSAAHYEVSMKSIYDNGCSFRVIVSAPDGEIVSCSTPRLATVPMYLNSESPEVRSWYEEYGPYLFTWPLDAQAEFSRRYEGATLRMPREDEADTQIIARRFGPHIHVSELTDDPDEHNLQYYITLCSERASADGVARYQVYCFAGQEITDTLPPTYALITFRASDGEFESKQILTTAGL